jgi:hypothetical protein
MQVNVIDFVGVKYNNHGTFIQGIFPALLSFDPIIIIRPGNFEKFYL